MSRTSRTAAAPEPDTALRRGEVLARIGWIQKATIDELRAFWRSHNGTAPVPTPRRALEQRLIYQVQELAYGGVSAETKARLDAIADADSRRAGAADSTESPVAGTRYIRIWRDERYEVTAVEGGFEYAGKAYRSLSAVAKAITGQHWNGKLFFGVGKHEGKGGGK